MRRRAALVLATTALVNAPPMWAQQWSTELQVGRIRSSLDPAAVASNSVAAGIRYDHPQAQFRLSGGIPTRSDDPYWGAIAGAKRFAVKHGGFMAGVDLNANGFLAHDRVERTRQVPGLFGPDIIPAPNLSGHALAGQIMPVLGFENQRLQLHARVGVSHYKSEFADQRRERDARLADVQLTYAPVASFVVVPNIRRASANDSAYTYTGIAIMVGAGRTTVYGGVGQWLDVAEDAFTWVGGATLRLHHRLTLSASARKDSFDPLYLAVPQTAWNLGGVLHVGGRAGTKAPVPARYVNGQATIRLSASQAKTPPSIAGDFNGWKPQRMQLSGGAWTYTIAVAPGVYNYAFVSENGEWFVPETYAGRKEDGMGGHVAVLVVQP